MKMDEYNEAVTGLSEIRARATKLTLHPETVHIMLWMMIVENGLDEIFRSNLETAGLIKLEMSMGDNGFAN